MLDRGEVRTVTTEGNGVLDAIFKGIKATGQDESSISTGARGHGRNGCAGQVTVGSARTGARSLHRRGYDTLFTSARATRLNKLQASERRVHAHHDSAESGKEGLRACYPCLTADRSG